MRRTSSSRGRACWPASSDARLQAGRSLKDVDLILAAAGDAGADLGMMPAIRDHFARAVDAGHGELDMSATYLEH